MKHQNTTQRALALRKNISARKRQRGFAMEWIIIVLLVGAAVIGGVLVISKVLTTAEDGIVGQATAGTSGEAAAEAEKYGEKIDAIKTNDRPNIEKGANKFNNRPSTSN